MAYKVQFQNGLVVDFENQPTEQEINEVFEQYREKADQYASKQSQMQQEAAQPSRLEEAGAAFKRGEVLSGTAALLRTKPVPGLQGLDTIKSQSVPGAFAEGFVKGGIKGALNAPGSMVNQLLGFLEFFDPVRVGREVAKIPGEIRGLEEDIKGQPADVGLASVRGFFRGIFEFNRDLLITPGPQALLSSYEPTRKLLGYPKGGNQSVDPFTAAGTSFAEDPAQLFVPALIGRGLLGRGSAARVKAGEAPTLRSNLADVVDTNVSRVAGVVTKPIGAALGGVKTGTIFSVAQVTGLNPETVKIILEKPQEFTAQNRNTTTREGISRGVLRDFTKRAEELSDLGKAYEPIRQSGQTFQVPVEASLKLLRDRFKLGVNEKGQVFRTKESLPLSSADIKAIQGWLDLYNNGAHTANSYLNARDALSQMSRFELGSGKTKNINKVARILRAEWNNIGRSNIKGLKELDATIGPVKEQVRRVTKDLFDRDGKLKDNAVSRIVNATGKGKEQLLRRIEEISPGATHRLKILKAIEDIEAAYGQKVGTYVRAGVGGAGILSGNVGFIAAAIITNPKVAVPILRMFGASKITALKVATAIRDFMVEERQLRAGLSTEAVTTGRPKAFSFVSPNVREGLTFEQARQALETPRHTGMKRNFEIVDKNLKVQGSSKSALGDWADGAENTVFWEGRSPGRDTLIYKEAVKALMSEQKQYIWFEVGKKGADALYEIRYKGIDPVDVKAALQDAGITFKTIGEQKALVFNKSGEYFDAQMGAKVIKAAELLGLDKKSIKTYTGEGGFEGSWLESEGARADAANIYRDIIKAYEQKTGTRTESIVGGGEAARLIRGERAGEGVRNTGRELSGGDVPETRSFEFAEGAGAGDRIGRGSRGEPAGEQGSVSSVYRSGEGPGGKAKDFNFGRIDYTEFLQGAERIIPESKIGERLAAADRERLSGRPDRFTELAVSVLKDAKVDFKLEEVGVNQRILTHEALNALRDYRVRLKDAYPVEQFFKDNAKILETVGYRKEFIKKSNQLFDIMPKFVRDKFGGFTFSMDTNTVAALGVQKAMGFKKGTYIRVPEAARWEIRVSANASNINKIRLETAVHEIAAHMVYNELTYKLKGTVNAELLELTKRYPEVAARVWQNSKGEFNSNILMHYLKQDVGQIFSKIGSKLFEDGLLEKFPEWIEKDSKGIYFSDSKLPEVTGPKDIYPFTEYSYSVADTILAEGKAKGFKLADRIVNELKNDNYFMNEMFARYTQVPDGSYIPADVAKQFTVIDTFRKQFHSNDPKAFSKMRSELKKLETLEPGETAPAKYMEFMDETGLAAEARKYATAEEFVKAQGQKVFHGTSKAGIVSKEGFKIMPPETGVPAFGEGISLTTSRADAKGFGDVVEAYIPDNLNLFKATDADAYRLKTNDLIKQGFDGVELTTDSGKQITIFDPSIIKTRSQLTDIWEQAQGLKRTGKKRTWTFTEAEAALEQFSGKISEAGFNSEIVGGVKERGKSSHDLDILVTSKNKQGVSVDKILSVVDAIRERYPIAQFDADIIGFQTPQGKTFEVFLGDIPENIIYSKKFSNELWKRIDEDGPFFKGETITRNE